VGGCNSNNSGLEIYPVTATGKIISGIVAVMGIVLIALPTGIISAGFIEKINHSKTEKEKDICPHCGKQLNS
jgi:voltage-gated potassium channel